jgi:hypothetical protein
MPSNNNNNGNPLSRREHSEYDLLVETKKELTMQLNKLLVNPIYDGFKQIWERSKSEFNEAGENNKVSLLQFFQNNLRRITDWSEETIANEYERIKKVTHWEDSEDINNLVTAVFLSRVKILSQIKFNKKSSTLLKVPTPKNFIHKVYITASRIIYVYPYYFEDRPEKISKTRMQALLKDTCEIIANSIDTTIQDLLPVREILKESFKDDDTQSSGSGGGGGNESDTVEAEDNYPDADADNESTASSSHNNNGGDDDDDVVIKSVLIGGSKKKKSSSETDGDDDDDEVVVSGDDNDDTTTTGGDSDDDSKAVSINSDEIIEATPSEVPPLEPRISAPNPILKVKENKYINPEPLFIGDSDSEHE